MWREWAAVEKMERSRAVLSSSLGSRLAHRRLVGETLHAGHRPERNELARHGGRRAAGKLARAREEVCRGAARAA